MCSSVYGLCRYGIGRTPGLGGRKDEQLIIGGPQYNGRCHTQLLPQYFVLDKDAVDAAN